ncbi:MAG: hypothetical protein GKC10_07435, partial [Methanosarcinales archaeon]|nr:hypothetical protein [Methanosarcinales archaeon]
VRDGNHAPANENDGWMETPFVISSDNQPPVLEGLTPDPASPQPAGARITWTAGAEDPEDTVLYRFAVDGQPATSWSPSPIWVWQTEGLEPGEHQILAWARDGSHAGEDGFDSALSSTFRLIAPAEEVQVEASGLAATGGALEMEEEVPVEAEGVEEEQAGDSQPPEPANQPPSLTELLADPVSPQTRGTLITWTAVAEDPEDAVLYRFLQNGQAVTGWTASRNWSWDTSESLPGEYRISVQVRDGRHAGEEGFDSSLDAVFTISSAIDQEIDRLMQGRGLGASQDTTEAIESSGVQVADANQAPRQAVLGKSRPASGDQGAPAMVRVGR